MASSSSWRAPYGWIISANGSLDFLSSEFDVGTALIVERMYREGQLASGESVTLACERKAKKRWLAKAARVTESPVFTHILREDNRRRG